MKDSEVVLEAAKRIAKKNCPSCTAICNIEQYCNKKHYFYWHEKSLHREYGRIFARFKNSTGYWLRGHIPETKRKNWRVLALLFFHEMLKSEGR